MWSLGVMLYNLITADSLWARPMMRDPVYASFSRDPRFWHKRVPLSLRTMALLDAIFVRERERISLHHLRQVVEQMETFYMSPAEIVSADRRVQESARRHGPWTCPPREVLAERREVHRGIGASGSHSKPDRVGAGGWRGKENPALLGDVGQRRTDGRIGQTGYGKPSSTSVDLPHIEAYGIYLW